MAERAVLWSDAARDDLRAIAFHIAIDSLENALEVVDALERRAALLARLSTRGRVVPELRRLAGTRFREVIEAPWRIVYRVEDTSVFVVAVIDSRRDLQTWLLQQAARFKASGAESM